MGVNKREMYFIDGENLVLRYQAMLAEGKKPLSDVIHEPDVYVWHPNIIVSQINDIIRVNYYTSAAGDDGRISQLTNSLQQISYRFGDDHGISSGRVIAKIFKKPKGAKSKGVDINLTIDALIHTFNNDIDTLRIVTGDEDYLRIVTETMRRGKRVFVSALTSGLSDRLAAAADGFRKLDDVFFQKT